MNIVLEATYTPGFTTLAASGAAADADSLPTCAVYEDTTSTAIVTPTVVNLATGVYVVAIPCTAVNGFEAGKTYNVVISATIGGVAAKAKVAQFVCVVNGLDAIAAAVWDEARSGHTTTGTFGSYVLAKTDGDAAIAPASTALSTATWTGTRAGYLDNLSAGAVATASALSTTSGNVTTILGQTGTTGVVVAAASKTGYTLSSAGLDSITVETGVNARQALSPILAAAAGNLSGAGTGTITIKGGNVATTRITATTDGSGNRSSITLSLPS